MNSILIFFQGRPLVQDEEFRQWMQLFTRINIIYLDQIALQDYKVITTIDKDNTAHNSLYN